MSNITNPTARTVLGIAKETVHGTAVSPTDYIPWRKFDPVDDIKPLMDLGVRGSMGTAFGYVQGPASSTVDMEGDVYPDTIGWLLGGILGDYAFTAGGGSAPNQHVFALLNSGSGQPTSHTITDVNPVQPREYPGCRYSDLAFKWDAAGLFTWTAKAVGWPSATLAAPSTSTSTLSPFPSWQGALLINSAAVAQLESAEITFKRDGAAALPNVDGSQGPYATHVGGLDVTYKATFIADAEATVHSLYLTGAKPTLDFSVSNAGTGTALAGVAVHASLGTVTKSVLTRGKQWIEYEVEGTFLFNTSDAGASGGSSPCKVTLRNLKATSLYV